MDSSAYDCSREKYCHIGGMALTTTTVPSREGGAGQRNTAMAILLPVIIPQEDADLQGAVTCKYLKSRVELASRSPLRKRLFQAKTG